MRVKVGYRTASKECYNKFCKDNPDIKLTPEEYTEILYTYAYMFRDYILETGEKIKMMWGFGYFSVNKAKTRKYSSKVDAEGKPYIALPIDWVKTKKEGKRIYNFNYHTNGFKFRWLWFRTTAYFYKSEIWNFKPSRLSSRTLGAYLNKKSAEYQDVYHEWV